LVSFVESELTPFERAYSWLSSSAVVVALRSTRTANDSNPPLLASPWMISLSSFPIRFSRFRFHSFDRLCRSLVDQYIFLRSCSSGLCAFFNRSSLCSFFQTRIRRFFTLQGELSTSIPRLNGR